MAFCENEEKKLREPSADWSWIVPPMSSSTTSVFHRYYEMNLRLPNYLLQQPPWTTTRGQSLIKRFAKKFNWQFYDTVFNHAVLKLCPIQKY